MDDRIVKIAERIKALREIMDVSRQEMADAAGISESEYDAYEKGEHDFTFSFLYTAAGKLGVDIVDLMTGEAPRLSICQVVKAGEGLKMQRRKEYKYEHLAHIFKDKQMEPFMVSVDESDTDAKTHMNAHDGQEFVYVVLGVMTLYIDDQELALNAGDAVYFDASYPHSMQASGGTCKFLSVIAK